MGRKSAEIPWDKVELLATFKFSAKSIAVYLGINEETLQRHIRRKYNLTYTDYQEKHGISIKQKLVQKAIDLALVGNVTMLIFCLKNYCGWSDKIDLPEDSNITKAITLNYKL